MATTPFNCRLTDDAFSRLRRLSTAPTISQADVIADALFEYERRRLPIAQRALLDVYDLVGDRIQPLQYIQEERDLTPEEQEVIDFLNRIWDEARKLKLFTEPSLPPEPWEPPKKA